jgi:hypothetical protein
MQSLALSSPPPSLLTVRPSAASPHAPWVGSSDVAARVLNSSGIRKSARLLSMLAAVLAIRPSWWAATDALGQVRCGVGYLRGC